MHATDANGIIRRMKNISHCHVFTSESVSEGHPDKVADQISDAILDACIKADKNAHMACETISDTTALTIASAGILSSTFPAYTASRRT